MSHRKLCDVSPCGDASLWTGNDTGIDYLYVKHGVEHLSLPEEIIRGQVIKQLACDIINQVQDHNHSLECLAAALHILKQGAQ